MVHLLLQFWGSLSSIMEEDEDDIRIALDFIERYRCPPTFKTTDGLLPSIITKGNDVQFMSWFRMRRRTFHKFVTLVSKDGLPDATTKSAIFLTKCATNNSFSRIADFANCGVGTAHRAFAEVMQKVNAMTSTYINWPTSASSRVISGKFRKKSHISNVIGAIDGTHIKIDKPSQYPENYVNRKNFYSLNVLAVCDADGVFTYVSCFGFEFNVIMI